MRRTDQGQRDQGPDSTLGSKGLGAGGHRLQLARNWHAGAKS